MTKAMTERFLDLLPEDERRPASALFFRVTKKLRDSEEAVDLALTWLRTDYAKASDTAEKARLGRLGAAIRDHREQAVNFASFAISRGEPKAEPF